jgi:hypothetical protein
VTCNASTSLECAPSKGGKACLSATSDPQFCGNCTTQCAGGTDCVNGACAAACQPGETLCNGTCTNLQSDPYNCNACGNSCPGLLNSDKSCQAGGCVTACSGGLTACTVTSGLSSGSACVNLQKDPTHCGACGTACGNNQVCDAGKCVPYILASACWECGDGNSMPLCCPLNGRTICTSAAACP